MHKWRSSRRESYRRVRLRRKRRMSLLMFKGAMVIWSPGRSRRAACYRNSRLVVHMLYACLALAAQPIVGALLSRRLIASISPVASDVTLPLDH